MKKKIAFHSVIPAQAGISLLLLALLAACGDTVENVYQTGLESYASKDELPKCNKDLENELVFVKDVGTALICVDGDWVATRPEGSENTDFSCKTVELKDKSGLKIVCNGDSIGVVLNGSDGKDGEKGDTGEGCTISGQTDSTVTIACGDKKLTMNMDGGFSVVEAENDSEKVAVSLDSLAGYTQKGPFLKGSTVYLYELSDGRTLKQTNGNFTSKITRDDGRYKFTARDLVSQYAMLVVDGFYRNEVTGQKSDASLRLTALTDMRKRSSANVNLLTHLEFDRVYQLVTRGDSTGKKLTVKQAKRQAQKEILKQFHIELDSNTDAEDMDVFGKTDADAALLAVSILLQGDSGTTDLSVLLTEISNDIAEYGEWKNDSAKAAIADWAMVADTANKLAIFSNNVTNWGLGGAPDFAKFVRDFWYKEYGIDSCTGKRDGEVIATKNEKSDYYNTKLRFICRDGAWKPANEFEKDTYGNKCTADSVGKVISGVVNSTNKYYCFASGWVSVMGWSWSIPKEVRLNPEIEYDTYKDPRDEKIYKIVTIAPDGSGYSMTWFAENLNYADSSKTPSLKGRNLCNDNVAKNCDVGGRLYTWAAAIDSVKLVTDADNPQDCGYGKTCSQPAKVQGICPTGWHLPSKSEWEALFTAVGGQSKAGKILKSQTGWSNNGNGSDAFGFAALPAGGRNYDGNFGNEGSIAVFWSSAEDGPSLAYVVYLYYNFEKALLNDYDKSNAFSVRCLRD